MYNSSFINVEANIVTITVHNGLNIAENNGPLCEIHQACPKKETADENPYL